VHDRLTQPAFRRRAAAAGAIVTSVWTRHSGLLVIATAVTLTAGYAFGPSWGWTCAALMLALALVHHVRHLSAMIHWLRDPSLESMPSGAGAWEDVYAGLYRMLRGQRRSASQLSDPELARRIADGDKSAFEFLMRRHNRALFRTARAIPMGSTPIWERKRLSSTAIIAARISGGIWL